MRQGWKISVVPPTSRPKNSLPTTPLLEARWQLQPHCRSCAYVNTCYRQTLSTDDAMLLPHLTPGKHPHLPSHLWYEDDLHATPANAGARLVLAALPHPGLVDAILEPQRPVTLVLAEHATDHQRSPVEANIVATLAARLLLDYGLEPERLAIVAPHRAQNNAISQRLEQLLAQRGGGVALPVIDTVERLQGAERDVLIFSVTTSDPDHLDSSFLNNPNRFNVAITRARHKLVVVGSPAFFAQIPHGETALQANYAFKAYYHLCREQDAASVWPQTDPPSAPLPSECQGPSP
jgi:hypothetical protein